MQTGTQPFVTHNPNVYGGYSYTPSAPTTLVYPTQDYQQTTVRFPPSDYGEYTQQTSVQYSSPIMTSDLPPPPPLPGYTQYVHVSTPPPTPPQVTYVVHPTEAAETPLVQVQGKS